MSETDKVLPLINTETGGIQYQSFIWPYAKLYAEDGIIPEHEWKAMSKEYQDKVNKLQEEWVGNLPHGNDPIDPSPAPDFYGTLEKLCKAAQDLTKAIEKASDAIRARNENNG